MDKNMKPEELKEVSKQLEEQIKLKIYDSLLGLLDDEKRANQTFAPVIEMMEKLKPGSKQKMVQAIKESMESQTASLEQAEELPKVVASERRTKRRRKLRKLQTPRRKRRRTV
ncbi:hypothetical protein [Hazenella coriacea]|uniref:Uncharacterized protein n=1 Tax=Hazenella coriacea TaxID=1179467 RepID=A0A4R3L3E4_9BACL|nr:hypothetical protein [Hazenella coriacea]TCS93150.1 hypothetical protein EDD58_10992 [Hazenella coriacea]